MRIMSWKGWLLFAGRLLRYDMISEGGGGVVDILWSGNDPVNCTMSPLLCIVVAGVELFGKELNVPL